MEAALKVKITPDFVAVKYECVVGKNKSGDPFQVFVDYNRLSLLIQKDMECSVERPGLEPLSGTIQAIYKQNGKIRLDISRRQ